MHFQETRDCQPERSVPHVGKSPFSSWLEGSRNPFQNNTRHYHFLLLPTSTWRSYPIVEETKCSDNTVWNNQTGTVLEACFLLTSFHSTLAMLKSRTV